MLYWRWATNIHIIATVLIILQDSHAGVLPVTPSTHTPFTTPLPSASKSTRHRCSYRTATPATPTADITFTAHDLENAQVIGQVDNKYIACLSTTRVGAGRSLVLIDQHAADERVSVENILRELCDGFASQSIRTTEVKEINIVLTSYEAAQLADPGVLDLFARWGIGLELAPPLTVGNYVQIGVTSVPAVLAYRLARKEGSELTRLVRQYLADLPDMGEAGPQGGARSKGWQAVQRWMPKEMLDLANSKACRSKSSRSQFSGVQMLSTQTPSCLRICLIWISVGDSCTDFQKPTRPGSVHMADRAWCLWA